MPRLWFYNLALLLPLVLSTLILYTNFNMWLWDNHFEHAYDFCHSLMSLQLFKTLIGGPPYPLFAFTVIAYWIMEGDDIVVPRQFLPLPFAYLPFTIIGDILLTGTVHAENLYVHPLIIIPIGYVYIFTWVVLIWVLDKFRLVA